MQSEKNVGLGDSVDFRGSYSGSYRISPQKMSQFNFYFNISVLIFMGLFLGYVAYLIIFPINPVEFQSNRIEVGMKVIRAGQVLPLRYPFVKHVDNFPTVHTRIIDTISYQLQEYRGSRGKGEHKDWIYSFVIPAHLPPGKYKIERIFEFTFNPIHTKQYKLISDEFEVIK
jgi:hypothetical protein